MSNTTPSFPQHHPCEESDPDQDYRTQRATVPAMEKILYKPFSVLDHGFIRVIDYMGNDAAIVQAARVSYGKGTKHVQQDKGLIAYLMRHLHTTPFEMCEIKCHVKLPIFVARQWIRHRTANVNEYSARYSVLGSDFYIPKREHLASQSTHNRQGRASLLTPPEADEVLDMLEADARRCYEHYETMLNCDANGAVKDEARQGLSRELARMNLTLNYYTEWYWKIDLHNLLHFIHLRADDHAQYEIRAYAELLKHIVQLWVPLTYQAFQEYVVEGQRLSASSVAIIRRMLAGELVTQETSGISKREWEELMRVLSPEEKPHA